MQQDKPKIIDWKKIKAKGKPKKEPWLIPFFIFCGAMAAFVALCLMFSSYYVRYGW